MIDYGQPVFFRVAMDVQMRNVVSDVKLQLNDSYHNLIEIQKQIIHYLNLIDYQNRIFEKVKKLKYLKDQFLLEERYKYPFCCRTKKSCLDGAAGRLSHQAFH